MENPSCAPSSTGGIHDAPLAETNPTQLIELFFPGVSMFTHAVAKYLHIDLNLYVPTLMLLGALLIMWRYSSEFIWQLIESYLMSSVDVRPDDEIYNMIMGWVAVQNFSKGARRFVANTNLNSKYWWLLWQSMDEDDEDEDGDGLSYADRRRGGKKKQLSYTPTWGTHYFFYRRRLLVFRRSHNRDNAGFLTSNEREEITISAFGRSPRILKELLHEARAAYVKRDEKKTLIYRGTNKSTDGPTWTRCMARTARPFSTVILNEQVKQGLIDDVTDYLDPQTRRWYANRGIPYRRGYLLHGPPGTGKSSLSLALAGFFKMRIYIVSLSSVTATEENLASLFAELPRRCVVLLEDIDTAGLTHTREDGGGGGAAANPAAGANNSAAGTEDDMLPGQLTRGQPNTQAAPVGGRLSLSGLLNILDGVASQEGRVLIMTTNHVDKLDKALIRPGRVDMIVKFDLADEGMIGAIFRAIYAPLEGDEAPTTGSSRKREGDQDISNAPSASGATEPDAGRRQQEHGASDAKAAVVDLEAEQKRIEDEARRRKEAVEQVNLMSLDFARRIPAHEFSPAELQGYLMKNKRDPGGAVERVEKWIEETRKEKREKEKEEAEKKRLADERKKKDEEKAKKKAERKKRKRQMRKEREDEEEEGIALSSSKRKKRSSQKTKKKRVKGKRVESSDDSSSDASSSESEAETAKELSVQEPRETLQVPVEKGEKDAEEKHDADSGYATPGTPT